MPVVHHLRCRGCGILMELPDSTYCLACQEKALREYVREVYRPEPSHPVDFPFGLLVLVALFLSVMSYFLFMIQLWR